MVNYCQEDWYGLDTVASLFRINYLMLALAKRNDSTGAVPYPMANEIRFMLHGMQWVRVRTVFILAQYAAFPSDTERSKAMLEGNLIEGIRMYHVDAATGQRILFMVRS